MWLMQICVQRAHIPHLISSPFLINVDRKHAPKDILVWQHSAWQPCTSVHLPWEALKKEIMVFESEREREFVCMYICIHS